MKRHVDFIDDSKKRNRLVQKIAARPEHTLNAEELIKVIDPEWVWQTDEYQRNLGATSLRQLIHQPFNLLYPDSAVMKLATTNFQEYDERVEIDIEDDPLLHEILDEETRAEYSVNPDEFRSFVLARRTIVAHKIFSAIATDLTTAS